jgi:spore coat polysaccharide biosynthesis predicted glycosyltransferase SpsG
VVISFGGADPCRLTEPVIRELAADPRVEMRVAVGPANPRRVAIEGEIARHVPRAALDRGELVESLAWADVAVIAGGTTLWEVGYVGLPTVAVVVADNQRAATKAAETAGFVVAAEPQLVALTTVRLLGDATRRAGMRAAGLACFDGRGAARAAEALLEVAGS